jgi:aflatoxin B1 aldehyde reductase
LSHHSQLQAEKGDGINIGASSLKHLEENLIALSKEHLPEDVAEAMNQGWEIVRGQELKFWH